MRIIVLLILLFISAPAYANPKLLRDLNKARSAKSFPLYSQSGDKIFFNRTTDEHSSELWVTDGTVSGTRLVKDIVPGTGSSLPYLFAPAKFGSNYGVYFFANTPANGTELWRSDGTSAGTFLVKDLNPGTGSSLTSFGLGSGGIITNPEYSYIYFSADDGTHGVEFCLSDGTESGTGCFDLNPGAASSEPQQYFLTDSALIFKATTAATGTEPFAYLGFGFPFPFDDIQPGVNSSNPKNIHLMNNKLVMVADDGTTGEELWQTDGSSSSLIADITPGTGNTQFFNFVRFNETNLFFSTINPALLKIELRSTNGNVGSNNLIKQMDCLPGGFLNALTASSGFSLSPIVSPILNGNTIFPCIDITFSESELWKSNGTDEGTFRIKDIFKGAGSADIFAFSPGNNRLIFGANNGINGYEPWFTDGTNTGTKIIKDFNPGEASSLNPENFYFNLFNLPTSSSKASLLPIQIKNKAKMLYTDGTRANSRILFDDSDTRTQDSYPSGFFSLGKTVYFAAKNSTLGYELYRTRGTKKSTRVLKNINPGGDSRPEEFVKLDSKRAVFKATTTKSGRELWITDGSETGTKLVKNLTRGNSARDNISFFTAVVRKKAFFKLYNQELGEELWVTNGKKRGTKLLKDIYPGTSSPDIAHFAKLGGKAIFNADDGVNGKELWITNGKPSGTLLLKDIYSGPDSSEAAKFTTVNGKVFFNAKTAANGFELWVTDGTADGTTLVKDICSGSCDSYPDYLTAAGDILFFSAFTVPNGRELWRSDGTEAGTFMIEDINAGAGNAAIINITKLGSGSVVFGANSGAGLKLWSANGTVNSALNLNAEFYFNSSLTDAFYKIPSQNKVIFSGYSATYGTEPWITDGSPSGTTIISDINPGLADSYPEDFFAKGNKLYFSATTANSGREPYIYKLP